MLPLPVLRAQGRFGISPLLSDCRTARSIFGSDRCSVFGSGRCLAARCASTRMAALQAYQRYMKKYIDTWRKGVHDLFTQYVANFLERPPADLCPEDLHMPRLLLPAYTAQLLSRLLNMLRSALPRFPDAPGLTALLSQLMYCATSFARLGFDFCTLLPPLFEDAVRTRVSSGFSRAVEEFVRTPETACAAVGAPRGGAETTAGVLHMPPQALVVYPPIAMLANALLAALYGLRLLAPAALLGDLASALNASLVKAFGTLLEAPREAQGAATAFLRVLVPFVRKGLIEGVYGSRVGDVPPSEALQEMMERMSVWVSKAETQGTLSLPLPTFEQ